MYQIAITSPRSPLKHDIGGRLEDADLPVTPYMEHQRHVRGVLRSPRRRAGGTPIIAVAVLLVHAIACGDNETS